MSNTERPILGGRYELYRRIARGGMAEVFLGRDQLLDRLVAVKVLFPEFATDPSFVKRFRREAQAAANLNQPNVVGVYDWGQENSTYYIVMEYVEGRSLAEIIRAEGPLHPDRAADIAIDISSALTFAHRNGVVHRDIKPGNVLITATGQVKVTDFGIARALTGNTDDNLTQTGSVMGTATYLSPEQAQGQPADPRSDVYSLSVVLYEMLTTRPPFTGDTPVSIAYKHVQEVPQPPSQLNIDIPDPLEAICLRGLVKEPSERYASAEDLRGDLRRFREGQHVLATSYRPSKSDDPTTKQPLDLGANSTAALDPKHQKSKLKKQPVPTNGNKLPPRSTNTNRPAIPSTGKNQQTGAPIWITLLVISLIIIGGLLFLLIDRSSNNNQNSLAIENPSELKLRVPELLGLDWEDAEALLDESGFENIIIEFQERQNTPENQVFQQDPRSGLLLADPNNPDNPIRLFVSKGLNVISVPSVERLNYDEAEQLLLAAGFSVNRIDTETDEFDIGIVISQDVPSTQKRPQGSLITLIVSVGRGEVVVPQVEGQKLEDARVSLARKGLLDEILQEFSLQFPINHVIRTEPLANERIERGSVIKLIVSAGPEIGLVPNLEILGITDADSVESAIKNLGYAVIRVLREVPMDDPRIGHVIGIEPAPGTSLLLGSDVILIVADSQSASLPSNPNTENPNTENPVNPNTNNGLVTVEPSN